MLRHLVNVVKAHLLISTAGLTCNIAMYPLNALTNVYPVDEGGGIRVHGGARTTERKTVFEEIVASQSAWPWGLYNVVIPHPCYYLFNLEIIGATIVAYPLSVVQLVTRGGFWTK